MAKDAAEKECAYQTAWQAGNSWADCAEKQDKIRARTLARIRAVKENCKTLCSLPEAIRAAVSDSIRADLEKRAKLFRKMAKLASGDLDPLIFYPDARLKEAFNEAAGSTVLR